MPRADRRRGSGRFRGTIAAVLAAAMVGVAVAAGAYALVRQSRLAESADRAVAQARLALSFAEQNLPDDPTIVEVLGVLDELRGGDFDSLAILDGQTAVPGAFVGPNDVPAELEQLVAGGQLAYQRTTVGEAPSIVVGAPVPGRAVELYLFRSEEALEAELARFAVLAAAAAALLVLVAAVAGRQAARHALRARIAALAEASDRERRFTADVAHELRTPLTALVNEAALLLDQLERLPPEARRPAELLAQDVRRLRRLVDDLLEISRLDAGDVPVRPERLDLLALVAAIVRGRDWEEAIEVGGGRVEVVSDRRRLERILANLLDNAVRHGGVGVTAIVGGDDRRAWIAVTDRGPGIPPEILPQVFERFAKGDPSRGGGGTGLGLAIARENARLLGGTIEAASEPGAGARFTLLLPVAEPLRGGDGRVAGVAEADGGNPDPGGGPR